MKNIFTGLLLLCITLVLGGCISTINVVPHQAVDEETSSVELGKTYSIATDDNFVLHYKGDYLNILKSNELYKPDIDTTFKSIYPPIKKNSRWQIVGKTPEGNYVAFPVDGYRPEVISTEPGTASRFMTSILGSAVNVAGGVVMNSVSGRINSAAYSSSQGAGSGLSPEMRNKVNNAAVQSSGGNMYLGAVNSFDNPLTNSTARMNVASGAVGASGDGRLLKGSQGAVNNLSGNSATDTNVLLNTVEGLYRIKDIIVFFDYNTLKPYALRPYVKRSDMDKPHRHIYSKILDSNGNFSLTKSFFAYTKSVLAFKGVNKNIASFVFKKFSGDTEKPVVSELIDVDLSKNKIIEIDGYKLDIISADNNKAYVRVIAGHS